MKFHNLCIDERQQEHNIRTNWGDFEDYTSAHGPVLHQTGDSLHVTPRRDREKSARRDKVCEQLRLSSLVRPGRSTLPLKT